MAAGFIQGAAYPLRGLRWLLRRGIRGFVLTPLLINILLFGAAIWWGASEFNGFLNWLLAKLPVWLDWLRWLLWPLFAVAVLLIGFYTFNLLANFIASPFNTLLAERVEDLVNPGVVRPPGRPLWREIVRLPMAELKKLVYFLLRAIVLLLPFLTPVVNTIAPFIWGLFTAWMLALQYMDYPLGNHLIPFAEQRRLLSQRRQLALGFGSAVLLLTMIPVVNFLAMPAAVIGATLLWVEQFPQARQAVRPAAVNRSITASRS
ncbi:MAG TPA: sulfate transporter CysZ [Candidatus Competibacteraceae bacterium]|nr:sulfate transporter CysZ [Candidatus Competibacteraceae bacterium]